MRLIFNTFIFVLLNISSLYELQVQENKAIPQNNVRCIVRYIWGELLENKAATLDTWVAPIKETNNMNKKERVGNEDG